MTRTIRVEKLTLGVEAVLIEVQIIAGMGTKLVPNLFSKTSNTQIADQSVPLFSLFHYCQNSEEDKEDATVGGTQDIRQNRREQGMHNLPFLTFLL